MNFASLCRIAGLSLALLLPATFAHANFEGRRESYPAGGQLVGNFKEGYYRLLYRDGSQQRIVIINRNPDGTYKVQGATGNATLAVYANTNGTCVMSINEDGSEKYAYFLATCNTNGTVTAYDSSLAARSLLKRRVAVKTMPFGTSQANKQFLQQLGNQRKSLKLLFTATPIKAPK